MAASYPGSVKTFTLKVDGAGNIIFAAHVNDLQDEVNAVEAGLLNGIAHVLRPLTNNLYDLGTAASAWRQLFLGAASDGVSWRSAGTEIVRFGNFNAADGSLSLYSYPNGVRTAIDIGPTRGTLPVTDSLAELVLYRTVDQATNYGRFNFSAMAAGGFRFGQEFGGSASRQDVQLAQENGVTPGTEVYISIGARDGDSQRIGVLHGHIRFEIANRGGEAAAYYIARGGGSTFTHNAPTGASHQFLVNNALAVQIDATGSGVLLLADPTTALQAATKQYVDAATGGTVDVLNAATATVDVVNTTTETDLYNFTVPANTLSTDRGLRFVLIGDMLKNDGGGGQAWTLRFYFGTTQYMTWTRTPATNSASRQLFILTIDLHAKGTTSAQVAWGKAMTTAGSTAINGSVGDTNADPGYLGAYSTHNAMTEDTTLTRAFRVSAQWAAANANLSIRLLSARLEVIR